MTKNEQKFAKTLTAMSESMRKSAKWYRNNGHLAAARHELKMARLCKKIYASITKRLKLKAEN